MKKKGNGNIREQARKIETDLHAHTLSFDLGVCAKNKVHENYALYRLNKFKPFRCFLAKNRSKKDELFSIELFRY